MSGFKDLPYSSDFWTIRLSYLELLLSQKEVLRSLTLMEKVELLSEARKKFSEKMQNENFSSFPGLQFTVRIMANTLRISEYPELKLSSNRQVIEKFADTGVISDASLFNEIIKMTDRFIENHSI